MDILFDNTLMLAPLAGYTDLPFRSVAKQFGADITVSEMISAHALAHNNAKTLKMIKKSPLESPYSVQIAGNSIEIIERSVAVLNALEGIDIIDLNCGCPAPKVSGHGSGSSLLKDLALLSAILKTIKRNSNKRYMSAKVRIGFDQKIPLEIAKAVEDAGADFIVVHGRTKSDGYKKEKIDYESIRLMKQSLSIPLIANGEIDSFEKAKEVREYTGADGVMIGRGAIGKPWIFHQIRHNQSSVSLEVRKAVTMEHFEQMLAFRGDYGAIMFRKQLHAYSKGLAGAGEFRDRVNHIADPLQMREAIERFFCATEILELF